MKNKRLDAIIEIITENDIDTQENMLLHLKNRGFNVTQATVSRDINTLELVKVPTGNGFRYSLPQKAGRLLKDTDKLFDDLLISSVVKVDHAVNTVCIKCRSGMAQAFCAKLDLEQPLNVVGTLAGEDTIFVLMRTEKDASMLTTELNTLLMNKTGNKNA